LAWFGENGAGKTTLIKHALGLLKAQSGSVRAFGLDPVADPVGVLSRIGYLSDQRDLPLWLRVDELLRYTRAFNGHYPVGWFTIYWAAAMVTFQALLWCLADYPKTFVVVLILVMTQNALNIFYLWATILLAIGLSKVSRVSFKEAGFWVFGHWLALRLSLNLF
jgi:energy-coupling factor transporter ATP-binding protein EcfA2